MIKALGFIILSLCLVSQSGAQEDTTAEAPVKEIKLTPPLGRVKSTTDVNTESSSFVPDPDAIDPLNPRRESLKEGGEDIVIEDIKSVLDAPAKPAVKKTENSSVKSEANISDVSELTEAKDNVKVVVKKNKNKKKKNKSKNPAILYPDQADLSLETKFNKTYLKYNKEPTSDDLWSEASSKQKTREYVVQKGDTLWSISQILFGDANFWPKLWAVNKQGILNPHFINPNTIIYFFEGDAQNSPSLSVGSDGRTGKTFSNSTTTNRPADLPDSLPLYRNAAYFNKQDREIIVQLTNLPEIQRDYRNDLVLTDMSINTKSQVKIKIEETAKRECYDGRILKSITYQNALADSYDIFQPVEGFIDQLGKPVFAYQKYGTAEKHNEKYLKMSSCGGLLITSLIILPKGEMEQLQTTRLNNKSKAIISGGNDVYGQKLYTLNQVVYSDFGDINFNVGQEYSVVSKITDQFSAKYRVVAKFGSYGIGVITDMSDVVGTGDLLKIDQ